MKCVGYIRVSTDGQVADGVSLDAQREKIAAYCTLHGAELLDVPADEGISGKRADNRPGLQRALVLACKYKAVLVVYSLSRLARSTRECLDLKDRLDRCGARLVSLTENIETDTPGGELYFTIVAAFAQMERRMISERTKMALAHKRSRGERISGRLPVGYKLADDGVSLAHDPAGQHALAVLRSLRADGLSYARIVREMNARSIPAANGGRWHLSVVYAALNRAA
jgi:site-specific DNA recombinase